MLLPTTYFIFLLILFFKFDFNFNVSMQKEAPVTRFVISLQLLTTLFLLLTLTAQEQHCCPV